MFSATFDIPILTRLNVDYARAVRKGAQRARIIIVRRTKAGKSADGKALPRPKTGGRRAFVRTGETIDSVKVFRVVRLTARVAPDGYHSGGKAGRAIGALKRAGKKVSKAERRKITTAAGRKGQARPLPVIMNALQSGAAGGKIAGSRPAATVMDLNDTEAGEVRQVMADDVAQQINEGAGLDFRNIRKVLGGSR